MEHPALARLSLQVTIPAPFRYPTNQSRLESVADYTQRPLYTISSGDLGISANVVEEKLSSALDLATSWNAIVLIDEADIFLEERSAYDLKRNGLVSGKKSVL